MQAQLRAYNTICQNIRENLYLKTRKSLDHSPNGDLTISQSDLARIEQEYAHQLLYYKHLE